MTPITTTLNAIRAHNPCKDGWEKLLAHLGKTAADDEPLLFSTIIEISGVNDACWCLRALSEEYYHLIGKIAADFAKSVLHIYEEKYPGDKRPRKAIDNARADVAWAAAETADAYAAAGAVGAAAAAWAATAAGYAAAAVAVDTAWAAAYAAAYAAVASDDAYAAERQKQAEILIKYLG